MLRFIFIFAVFGLSIAAHAGESVIVEETGSACINDKTQQNSKQETEQQARAEAKRLAAERVATRIRSETRYDTVEVRNEGKAQAYKVASVLVSAYAQAQVRILSESHATWYRDATLGECFKVKLRAEVIPDSNTLAQVGAAMLDDPTLPLNVRLYSDRSKDGGIARYRNNEKMQFYLRGNKPFYARILYHMADGSQLQLLPNAYRPNHYFQGGVTYLLPNEEDDFSLVVSAPFGAERIVVYASERPLDAIRVEPAGAVYRVAAQAGANLSVLARARSQPTSNGNDRESENDRKPDSAAELAATSSVDFSEYAIELLTLP